MHDGEIRHIIELLIYILILKVYLKLTFDVGLVHEGVEDIEDAEHIPCLVLSVQSFNLSRTQLGCARSTILYCSTFIKHQFKGYVNI